MKRKDPQLTQRFEEVMASFDWDAVLTMMRAVNWRHGDGPATKESSMEIARRVFHDLCSDNCQWGFSGGFCVDLNKGNVTLSFVGERVSSGDLE